MKKIFSMAALFAAGLLGFTSCSNDDVAQGGAFSQDALAVSFAAVKTDGAVTPAKGPLLSRAAGVTTTSLTNIYVQATNSENAVYFGDGTTQKPMELFTYDGSSEFRSTTNHYWPNNAADGANNTLNFYASNQQEALTAGTETNPSPIVDDYECDGIKDWVTATVKAGEKTIPYPLTFQHVLSQIKISAEAKDKTQDLVYKVVGVKLSAPDTGDYQFANATAGVGTWTIDNSSSADYTYEQNMNGQFNPTAATEAEQTWASTDYFNILPVATGTLTFDVQYQVIQNGQVIGDFTGANSKQVTVDAPNLLSGKIYTYNFVLAINTNDVITFTVSTNSWTDGSTTDVQVPLTYYCDPFTKILVPDDEDDYDKDIIFGFGVLKSTGEDSERHTVEIEYLYNDEISPRTHTLTLIGHTASSSVLGVYNHYLVDPESSKWYIRYNIDKGVIGFTYKCEAEKCYIKPLSLKIDGISVTQRY